MHLTFLRPLLLCLTFVCASVAVQSAPPAGDPAPELLKTIDKVLDLTIGHPPEEIVARVPQIRAAMDETFATAAIVQRSLGRNWGKLSKSQQNDVIDLLGRIIIRTYAAQLSTAKRPTIRIVSSTQIAPERREIATVASIDDKSVNIIYRLAPIDGRWRVYDVLAENVSVVGNYRQQFDAHFEKKSAEALLDTLREKLTTGLPADKPLTEEKK